MTAIAYIRTGHKCYTVEKNKEYFDAAIKRPGRFLPAYKPSETISMAMGIDKVKDDINCKEMKKESKVAADVLLSLSNMHGDGFEPAQQLSTAQTPFQLCDDDFTPKKEDKEMISM